MEWLADIEEHIKDAQVTSKDLHATPSPHMALAIAGLSLGTAIAKTLAIIADRLFVISESLGDISAASERQAPPSPTKKRP